MSRSKPGLLAREPELLAERFDRPLRPIALRAVTAWFSRDRLDAVLADVLAVMPECELVYAIDIGGRQMSSNLHPGRIDRDAYWQDLSRRPITIPLLALNERAFSGAFLCDSYISRVTQQTCLTLMYGVRTDSSLLGFIAADFAPDAVILQST